MVNGFGACDVAALLKGEAKRNFAVEWLGGAADRERLAAAVSPLRQVRPGVPAVYTVHGTANLVGPFAQSVALREALSHAGIRNGLLPLPGANDGQFSAQQVRLAWEAACWFLGR